MSVKKTVETTSQKILNSDIYDITRFVDDIKKQNIDGVDNSETLMVGMYGYLGYQFSSLLQNAIVTASELSNEAIPTRAKFDRNVITHALSLGVEKVAATAANMNILLMFPEKALQANMIDGEFRFSADTPLNFDKYEFHTDYDIVIKYVDLTDSTNGSQRNYVYTATYDMTNTNPISDIENPFLPPVTIFNYEEGNMVVLSTNIHQVYYKEIYEKILGSDVIANKTINFSFDNQMSHFNIVVKEPSSDSSSDSEEVYLTAVYDGLYNQEIAGQKYCYYQYINSNTIRIRFDPTNYQPPTNSDLTIECYTTSGASGNFEYSEQKTIRLTSDKYTNLYCIIAQRDDYGSTGGLDRQTVKELQHIIPKEALSRGSITTLTDLRNFFNSLNNENSVLHVFRKEDNILDRVYYVYNLMKDSENNIVPTNTIPVYIESNRRDTTDGNIYIESGTPIFYYKYGDGANTSLLQNNYVGYLQQKVANNEIKYSFYDSKGYTTFQGIPTSDTLETWYELHKNDFDVNITMGNDFKYEIAKPENSYDFHEYGNIYFKPYSSSNINCDPTISGNEEIYDKWYYGTSRRCELKRIEWNILNFAGQNISIFNFFNGKKLNYNDDDDIIDLEITWQESNTENGITTTKVVHFPMESTADIDPEKNGYVTVYREGDILDNNTIVKHGDGTIKGVVFTKNKINSISSIKFFRPRIFDSNNNIIGKENSCFVELPLKRDYNEKSLSILFYAWTVSLSFYDESCKFSWYSGIPIVTREFLVSDYIVDLSELSIENRKAYTETYYNFINLPLYENRLLILDTINTIDAYSYDGQDDFSFDSLTLAEGDLIRFKTYEKISNTDADFNYINPSTWTLGEVLSIEKNNGRIISVELLVHDDETGQFESIRYTLPLYDTDKRYFDETYIVLLSKITKFLYTNPLSIVLRDDPTINTHRVMASYYLDIIDETRYLTFDCINSKSPMQFIVPYIKTYRSSYLSNNRYKYDIKLNLTPNTGTVDKKMVNRIQVIGVLYKKSSSDSTVSNPIMYTIAKYMGGDELENVTEDGIPYEFNLYTRPFTTSTKEEHENKITIIDDNNDVYFGPAKLIEELIEKQTETEDSEEEVNAKREFYDSYRCYYVSANNVDARPNLDSDQIESKIDLDSLPSYYAGSIHLNLNTDMKIYILYKYDIINTRTYTDGLTKEYLSVNSKNNNALYNSVPQGTEFIPPIEVPIDDEAYVPNYTLKEMVLANVYSVYQGINLLYDYSNIMNSYVTSIKTNDIFSEDSELIESYIINRVPCVRYFYWWSEDRVLEFIKEMKKKINYVLDAIDPLECTFGLDYKFFNTYGPSNMYHLTDDDGDVTDLIDNVALTMTFRAKFYNEDSDAWSIKDNIKDSIKDYLENLDELDDIHFPNITTMIETEYSEYLIYFEFVSFNIYDALYQHIITVEDMEMLSMVPEFLHVDTNDYNGLPYINIRIVT